MLAATSWFFAFDLNKLKIEEGRCPPESLFWTNHAFSLSLSHQRGQGGSSLALHSIFHKTEYQTKSEFAQKLPWIEFYSTYIIFPVKFWICCYFEKNSLTELSTFQNQPMKLREIVNNNKCAPKLINHRFSGFSVKFWLSVA